jgi:hypothetical protein
MASRSVIMKSALARRFCNPGSFPSLGSIFSPVGFSFRRFSLQEKERAEERIYISKKEKEEMERQRAARRVELEKELTIIYAG